MSTTWGVARSLVCALIVLGTACGDNLRGTSEELVVTPAIGLHTNETGGTATFTVALAHEPTSDVRIDLASSNVLEGTVSPAVITLTRENFAAGQTVTITGIDDDVADGSRSYTVRVAPAIESLAAVNVQVANDDDDAIAVRVTPTSGLITTKQGGQATFDVVLTSKPGGAVVVPLSSSDITQGTIDESSLTFTDANWNVPRTVTITGVNDGLFNGNVEYTIVTAATTSTDATYNGLDPDNVTVTNVGRTLVTLEVTPANATIALGTGQQYTATGVFDDSSRLDLTLGVTWSSTVAGVATISNATATKGFASSHATGATMIRAVFGVVTGQTTLTVTPATLAAIQITPPNQTIADGTTQQLTATGVYSDNSTQDLTGQALWSSSLLSVATISNASGSQGRATAIDPGITTLTATVGAISGTTTLTVTAATLVSIEVTPVTPSIAKGSTQQFTATGRYTDGSTQPLTAQATWASSATTVATISNVSGSNGVATAVAQGSTTISATFGGITGSTILTVTAATLQAIQVTPTNPSTTKASLVAFTATGVFSDNTTQDLTTQVTWSSSSQTIATISNASGTQGVATAQNVGQTTITATLGTSVGSTMLTVTPATLVSFLIAPINATAAKGTTVQYAATAFFSDNTSQDVTATTTWSSSVGSVATISNATGTEGLASAVGTGVTTITANFGGLTRTTSLTVSAAVLVRVEVTPTNPSIAKGTNLQFTATAVFSDGSTQNVTATSVFSSTNTTVATIGNANGNRGRATGQNVGTTTISATFSGVVGSTTLTVTAATLQSIQVTPTNPTAAKGTTLQFTATGTFSDNTTQDLTTVVTWSSSTTAVATISNAGGSQGLASAATQGTTTISATFGGRTGSTTLTVSAATLASIQITPSNPSAAKGTTVQFVATGLFTDGTSQDVTTQVTWSSTVQSVASISNASGAQGLASTVDTGVTEIRATSGAIVGSTSLTVTAATLVSIQVTPVTPSIAKGTTLQLFATGVYSDNSTQDLTTQVTWSSTTIGVATISNASGSQGLASAIDVGSTSISATFGGTTGSTTLTVTAATLASIQVTPANPTIAKGTTLQFTATGIYTDSTAQDLTTQVSWSSSTGTVATISNATGSQGRANAVDMGTTTIGATLGAITGSTTLTVTAATLVSVQITPTNPSIADGTTLQLTAIGTYTDNSTQDLTTQATWSTTTSAVATVSNAAGSQGLATAEGTGTTTIGATVDGRTGTTTLTVTAATLASIQVTPTNPSIADGTTLQFTAIGTFTDGSTQDLTDQSLWSSTNSTVASISNAGGSQGFATANDPGSVTIAATSGGITGSTTLVVTPATLVSIQITPVDPSIAKGTAQQFIAIGTYTDNSTQDLTTLATWSSTNAAVATISNAAGSQGLASSVDVGSTLIRAIFGGRSAITTLTVTAATLVSIEVTPTNPSASKGTTVQFTATGLYTDGSTQDLTDQASWSSTNINVATVSNATGSKGSAFAVEVGSASIRAALGTVVGATTLTVNAATLVSVQVTPTDPTIADGTTLQLTATGLYTDGSTQDVTTLASWSSTNSNVATVSNASGSQGLATSVDAGSTTVTASFGGRSGTTTLTVTAATLVSIDVTPTNPSIANGTTQQFTATGLYSDSSTQDLTAQATWSSTVASVATISNTAGSNGLASATGNGATTIRATFGTISGSTTLTVTGVTLTSVVVTPVNPTMAKGSTVQFTCTGVFSDNSTQDLTTTALWSTTNAAVATVSNASGSQGLATAVEVGTADIGCTVGGFSDSSTVTVTAATISSIVISPANPSIANGVELQFTATVTFSSGVVQDITDSATWTSSNTAVATISNQVGFEGIATSANVGTTTITANFGGANGTTTLTVTNATLTAIALQPVNPTIARNTLLQFIAIGTFSDGSTADITTVATWTTTNTTVATISNAAGSEGVATGVAPGTATISALLQGRTGSTTLTVTNATLVSIAITPSNPTMAAGTQLQLTATGTFSDGSTQNLTFQVSWKSQNKSVAKVFQGRRKRGLATAINPGTSLITASTLGISGTTTITVP